ncbi:hypothetical protein ACFOWE_28765 [Planomonospora corallina]|uniref:Uncharacterized protein n=1 Tax=Planomonospora corallina TaxID=1806052 RepID=A0ABV8IE36_9ACTN
MSRPGAPGLWVGVAVLSALAVLFVPPAAGGLPALVLAPAAMYAAVITAYRQAARIRAGRDEGIRAGRDGGGESGR